MIAEHDNVFRLYLLRHAHAGWPSPGLRDYDRPLDALGLSEARNVALQAYTAGLALGTVISSPARRCRETTEAFLEIYGDLTAIYDETLYSEGVEAYIAHIRHYCGQSSLMLVGHNPMIEALALQLSEESEIGSGLMLGYPTAGLFALDFSFPTPGSMPRRGEPALLLTPALT